MNHPAIRLSRAALLLVLLSGITGACGPREPVAEGDIVGWRPATRTDFMAMPESARLNVPGGDGVFASENGVAVEVRLRIEGMEGESVPFAYALHGALNNLPLVSTTIQLQPDAPRWRRQGHVWLPVPGPGSYYVRVTLNDSAGRRTDGPRTEDFTIQ